MTNTFTYTRGLCAALLRHTHRAALAARGLGALAAHADTPEVAQAAVAADLAHARQVRTQGGNQLVGRQLRSRAVFDVAAAVQKVVRDLVLARVRHHVDEAVDLLVLQLAGALARVDVRLLADQEGKAPTAPADGSQSECDLTTTVDVRRHDTQDVLKLVLVEDDRRHIAVCHPSISFCFSEQAVPAGPEMLKSNFSSVFASGGPICVFSGGGGGEGLAVPLPSPRAAVARRCPPSVRRGDAQRNERGVRRV